MKIDEALQALRRYPGMFARPMSWRGKHMAYTFNQDGTVAMLTGHNPQGRWVTAHAHMTSLVSELCEEWELVSAEEIESGG